MKVLLRAKSPLIWIIFTSLVVRLAVSWAIGWDCYSVDVKSWERVASLLEIQRNPYQETKVLNWGPGWMIVLSLIRGFGVSALPTAIRSILIIADAILILQISRIGELICEGEQDSDRRCKQRGYWALVFLYAIHPVPALLSVQHLNFDALFLIPLLGAIMALLRSGGRDRLTDLVGALLLGIAGVIKTPALVGVPLLFRIRGERLSYYVLAASLALGPLVLGLAVLFAISGDAIVTNVIEYRSVSVFAFGLGHLSAGAGLKEIHSVFFIIVGLGFGIVAWKKLRSGEMPIRLMYIPYLFFLYVLVAGTGFGPQYMLWVWVFLPIIFVFGSNIERFFIIVVSTFAGIGFPVLYSVHPYLGNLFRRTIPWCQSPGEAVVVARSIEPYIYYPLYISVVLLFMVSAREYFRGD